MGKKIFIVLISTLALMAKPHLFAAELNTFKFEHPGGKITVTQEIPSLFFGKYESITMSLRPGGLLLNKGKNRVSNHWWDSETARKKFTWGVVVEDGKILTQKVLPPNPEYAPYDKMRLILQYDDGSLLAMGLYRAKSEKYGTIIVVGRYRKK